MYGTIGRPTIIFLSDKTAGLKFDITTNNVFGAAFCAACSTQYTLTDIPGLYLLMFAHVNFDDIAARNVSFNFAICLALDDRRSTTF